MVLLLCKQNFFYFCPMQIQHESDHKGGKFFIEDDGRYLAVMTYIWAGEQRMVIDHTEVDASLKGQGVGAKLVAAAVASARDKGFRILPLCPFAKAVMTKEESYADVTMH
jgi:predicted GNAT family acetyltransferase